MRILILNHNDREKGTYFRCFALGKSLAQMGYDIVLSCLNPERNVLKTTKTSVDGVILCLVPGQHGASSLMELPFHLLRALINTKMALLGKYDAVYSFNVASPTTGLPVVFLRILKKAGIFHGQILVDCDDLWGKGGLTTIDQKGWVANSVAGFLETKIPILADQVTVASHALKEMIKQARGNAYNIFLVPNGANPAAPYFSDTSIPRDELKLPSEKPIVCFVGRALWVFDYLMAGLELAFKQKPDILFVCIAPWNNVHLEKINKSELSDHILCPGVQPHEKISLYLGAADVLLLPRVKNGSEMYNFPGRLGDYLAAGRPIVSTANSDENELIMRKYNCGLLAEPDSPASFAEKILQLLNDPKLRREIGENNRKTATDKFSWAIIGQDFADSVLRK